VVTALAVLRWAAFGGFVASVLYVHFRGRERLSWRRQITDHSTFLAPYNALVYLFSAVPRSPILDTGLLPGLERLRENWRTIREEALRLWSSGLIRASDRHDDLGFNSFFRKGWKRFYLTWYGETPPSALRHCPKTIELLRSVPGLHGAMFALMEPRSRVGNHRDPFAGSLRYHLGLATPNSDLCRIFINGTPYSWRDGEGLLFDETYVHRFENLTDQPRLILFCDVERPLRTAAMRALNRFAIRWILPLTVTKNEPGERVGLANRAFGVIYASRPFFKELKRRNRSLYYALKYAGLGALVYLALFVGIGRPKLPQGMATAPGSDGGERAPAEGAPPPPG
jgi:beta-hydroxylase